MLSMNDIINVSFRRASFTGYRTDDVDQFVDDVKETVDSLIKKQIDQKEEYEKLKEENNQLLDKLKVLADKVEEYRMEEDEIKNALVSAQKLGDASIRESRHKAEIIIKDANVKSERIISGAKQSVIEQQKELERLQQTVSDFRSQLLNAYKEHLTLINALPSRKKDIKKQSISQPVKEVNRETESINEQPLVEQDAKVSACEISDEIPDDVLNVEVSNFDENINLDEKVEPVKATKISDQYDISDDNISPDGILNQNI